MRANQPQSRLSMLTLLKSVHLLLAIIVEVVAAAAVPVPVAVAVGGESGGIDGWACSACTFVNANAKGLACSICGTERQQTNTPAPSHIELGGPNLTNSCENGGRGGDHASSAPQQAMSKKPTCAASTTATATNEDHAMEAKLVQFMELLPPSVGKARARQRLEHAKGTALTMNYDSSL